MNESRCRHVLSHERTPGRLALCKSCLSLILPCEVLTIGLLGRRVCDGCWTLEPPLAPGSVASTLSYVARDVVFKRLADLGFPVKPASALEDAAR